MYKIYIMKFKDSKEVALLAKNNKEAMVLAGRAIVWYGDILKVTDCKGLEVLNNEKNFLA